MDGGLEHFTRIRRIDAAGTAELWQATDADDEVVALTLLEPGSAGDRDRADWVARAADAGRGLRGPHLVPIREHGVDGDRLYVCREWMVANALADLSRADLHPGDAVEIVDQLARALDTAYRDAGIVHGDLRARHVLVVPDADRWRVVLVGFEWARLAGLGPRPGPAGAHLAPERFAGEPAVHGGDVYSLAVLLYDLLAGFPPFEDGRPPEGGREVPSVGGPGRGPWDRMLRAALAEDPAGRPGTGAELARAARAALAEWRDGAHGRGRFPAPPDGAATGGGPGAAAAHPAAHTADRAASGPGSGARPAAGGTGAGSGAAEGGGNRGGGTAGPGTTGPGTTGPGTTGPGTTGPGTTGPGTTSGPDGRASARPGAREPRTSAQSGARETRTSAPSGARGPRPPDLDHGPPAEDWATRLRRPERRRPRQRWVLGAIAATVVVLAAAGIALAVSSPAPAGALPTVELGGQPVAVATSPDPRTVVVADATGNVGIVDLPSRTVVARVPVGEQPSGIAVGRWGRFAYAADSGSGTVSVVDVPARRPAATIPVGDSPVAVTVRADGARAYVANRESANITVIDTSTRSVVDTIAVGFLPWKTLEGIAVSRDGSRAVVTLDSGLGADTLQVVDLTEGEVTGAVPVGRSPRGVAISPDGRRAWVADSGDGAVSAIDLASLTRPRTIAVGGTPTTVLLGGGGRAWVPAAGNGTVAALDVTNGVRLADPAPGVPATAMSIGVGGRSLHLLGPDGVLTTVPVP